jgi:hypothetical protein
MQDDKVFVLHWENNDRTANDLYGIEMITKDEEEAVKAHDLLDKYDTSRKWFIDEYKLQ